MRRHASGAHGARVFGLGSELSRRPPHPGVRSSMASDAIDGDVAELSEAKFTFKPSAVELSASEEERLRTLGLERRSGVPGLYLLRALDRQGNHEPVVPAEEIKLEGELKVKAERLRDELIARLKEKGTEGLPTGQGSVSYTHLTLPTICSV